MLALLQSRRLANQGERAGLYKCASYPCRKQFSVTVGTFFERSKVSLSKRLMAVHLMCASKKGISAKQVERMFVESYKTACFMCHRIRHAIEMKPTGLLDSGSQVVEADETYIGRNRGRKVRKAWGHKNTIVALVERGGQVRSTLVTGRLLDDVKQGLRGVSPNTRLVTDEASMYYKFGRRFVEHMIGKHGRGEYVQGEAHINTPEG